MDSVERVEEAMAAAGLPGGVTRFAESTATAEQAAAAVGCELGQIVKTLFFFADGRPTVVLVAGDRQADTAEIARILGVGRKKLKMGSPDDVLAATGFPVGGVSPLGLRTACDVLMDESLQRFDVVWAAAGAQNAVFGARTGDLAAAIGAQWAHVTREA